jgi:beta-glucanase (GH16 family)
MTEPTAGPAFAGWELVWSDEFDGVAGTPPDPAIWGHALGDGTADGNPGWGNRERESYTDDPANAAMDGNGNLVITARAAEPGTTCYYGSCEYTSARLLTRGRFSVAYGRIEARIKVPAGHGLWPAFWMLGTDIDTVGWPASGEIDVMENVGRVPHRLFGTIHGPGYSGSHGFGKAIDLAAPLADDFHSYAVEWRAGEIIWSVDDTTYHRATPGDVAPNAWAFDHEFYLLLNLAVGGELGGLVSPDTVFPASLVVDHVRIYRAT